MDNISWGKGMSDTGEKTMERKDTHVKLPLSSTDTYLDL